MGDTWTEGVPSTFECLREVGTSPVLAIAHGKFTANVLSLAHAGKLDVGLLRLWKNCLTMAEGDVRATRYQNHGNTA